MTNLQTGYFLDCETCTRNNILDIAQKIGFAPFEPICHVLRHPDRSYSIFDGILIRWDQYHFILSISLL